MTIAIFITATIAMFLFTIATVASIYNRGYDDGYQQAGIDADTQEHA